MSFFGNATKPYNNSLDPDNGKFYTIPVRYEFKDRDTRARAEKILKSRCNVSCSTPYPPMLRECMRQTTNHFRVLNPGCHVTTSVDLNSMTLRVFKKESKDGAWIKIDEIVPIPEDAYNLGLRAVPKGYKMPGLVVRDQDVTMSPPNSPKPASSKSPGRAGSKGGAT
jgi:hypothetical protein